MRSFDYSPSYIIRWEFVVKSTTAPSVKNNVPLQFKVLIAKRTSFKAFSTRPSSEQSVFDNTGMLKSDVSARKVVIQQISKDDTAHFVPWAMFC